MPKAKYIMKNRILSLQSDKWEYCIYDKSYKNIYNLILTPDQAKCLPLKSLSPMEVYCQNNGMI